VSLAPSAAPRLVVSGGALGDQLLRLPLIRALATLGPLRLLAPRVTLAWVDLEGLSLRLDAAEAACLFGEGPLSGAAAVLLEGVEEAIVLLDGDVLAQALRRRGLRVHPRGGAPDPGVHQLSHLAAGLVELPMPEQVPTPFLRLSGSSTAPDVLLLPGSGGLMKCWPAERFQALGADLQARGLTVAVALGPDELERGPGPERFVGLPVLEGPSLAELAALCAAARLVVGNDAGTTHLAAAAGAQVLALFGPTDPARWRPLGPRVTVLNAGAALADLPHEAVLDEVMRLIGQPNKG
jgi:hypothetical protein